MRRDILISGSTTADPKFLFYILRKMFSRAPKCLRVHQLEYYRRRPQTPLRSPYVLSVSSHLSISFDSVETMSLRKRRFGQDSACFNGQDYSPAFFYELLSLLSGTGIKTTVTFKSLKSLNMLAAVSYSY
jgi:hypothetical protein